MQTNGLQELITHRVAKDIRQSVYEIRRTFTWGGHKIRATIHHDPYEFQADFYSEVFNPNELKWNRVHTADTGTWYNPTKALGLNRMSSETWDECEMLIDHLVSVAQDLLEGIPA